MIPVSSAGSGSLSLDRAAFREHKRQTGRGFFDSAGAVRHDRTCRLFGVQSMTVTALASYGSTVTSTNAGTLSAPFLSVTRNLKRNSLGSETAGATKEAFGMLRSRSGTFAPRTWLQV